MSSAPSQLHELLRLVQETGGPATSAWASVFGSDYGTAGFVASHAEVMTLLSETVHLVSTLPERSRERYRRYVADWWAAAVSPQVAWSQSGLTWDQGAIDQLAALGDLIDSRMHGTLVAPNEEVDLGRLREECRGWIKLISESSSLERETRDALVSQFQHVVWLITNVNLFGPSRAIREAGSVAAAVHAAGDEVREPEQRKRWQEAAASLTLAFYALTGFTNTTLTPMLEAGATAVEQADRLADGVSRLLDGSNDSNENEVIDGIIVDEPKEDSPQA